jgi:uncharacterized protein (DUF58 family)
MPTRAAIAAFVGCALMLAIGLASATAPIAALAGAGFAALALALAATMPLGRRVRAERLEFAWWLGHGDPNASGGAVTPGAPFLVRCYVRHRGTEPILLSGLQPLVPGGARVVDGDEEPEVLWVAPRSRTEFAFKLLAPACGRVVLHGLAVTLRGPLGLFEVPLYFPNPLAIKVLPAAAATSRGASRTMTGLSVERSATTQLRRQGGGTELRELRDLQPGDPFKSIAWRPSARAGKLLVREVEREVQETRYLVLDVSGTMRGGAPGRRKLDFVIEAAAAEARRAINSGDRVGLVTVDGRILAHVAAGEGAAHMIRIYDALLGATEVVDHDLTDVDDDELIAIVARYVRHQDGIDFASRDRPTGWDVGGLVAHATRALAGEQAKEAARGEVLAPSPVSILLRRFCRARGIPLPYRPDPRDGAKAPGLATALREAAGRTRVPRTIVVVTDFDGIGDPEPLVAAVKLLRSHGHALVFVAPDARHFAAAPSSAAERDLSVAYGRGEERRLREAHSLFGKLGAPVFVPTKGEPAALVIARARTGKRAA